MKPQESDVQWVRYVRHHQVPEFEAKGWVVRPGLEGTNHGVWSTFMVWPHEGDPPDAR